MDDPIPPGPDAAWAGSDVPTLAGRVATHLSKSPGGLPAAEVSRVVSDVAAELDALHGQGRTHGDVRAARIAVPSVGRARLLGPEWRPAAGGTLDGDVTGLVAAASFALSGVEPTRSWTVPPSGISAASAAPVNVAGVLAKGLAPLQGERYATAGEFAAALREAVLGESVIGGTTAPVGASRPRRSFVLPAACVLLALALGAWLGWGHQRSPQAEQRPPPPQATASLAAPPPLSPPAAPAPTPAPPPRTGAIHTASATAPPPHPPASSQKPLSAETPAPVSPPATQPAPVHLAAVVPPPPPPTKATVAKGSPARVRPQPKHKSRMCYLRVYARQFVSMQDVVERRISAVRPRRVLVDGNPSQALAAGHWAAVTPGAHRLAFYPAPGVPFDPNTKFWVRVGPRHRRSFQIPLPRHPGGIPGYIPKKRSVSAVDSPAISPRL